MLTGFHTGNRTVTGDIAAAFILLGLGIPPTPPRFVVTNLAATIALQPQTGVQIRLMGLARLPL